jgi:hypothetical protein
MQELVKQQSDHRRNAGYGDPFRWKGGLPSPSVRDVSELAEVLADPGCSCTGPAFQTEFYFSGIG